MDLLLDVDALLAHPVSPKNLAAAFAVLEKNNKEKLLLSYWAKALVLAGKPEAALAKVEAALASSGLESWPYFWKAAALVQQGASPKAWAPALKVAFKGDRDVAKEALQQPAFEGVRESAAFLAAIGRKTGVPTVAREVKKLIAMAEDGVEPWPLFKAAAKLDAHADQASVLDAKLFALKAIVEDLDEHGDANLDMHGGRPEAFFREALKNAKAARKKLGRTKSAFGLAVG